MKTRWEYTLSRFASQNDSVYIILPLDHRNGIAGIFIDHISMGTVGQVQTAGSTVYRYIVIPPGAFDMKDLSDMQLAEGSDIRTVINNKVLTAFFIA